MPRPRVATLRQTRFDPLGPHVRSLALPSGRSVRYIDEGDPGWTPLLWFGGAGTSVRAFRLLEFARTLREQLRVRVVSLERNGLGGTPFDPNAGYPEYAADVWALLDRLGIANASLLAISGGGPYAAHVAAAAPGRVRSLHLACAYAERLGEAALELDLEQIARDPVSWWRYPPESPVHRIPGFADSAVEEATAALFARGRDQPPEGLALAFALYAGEPLPDLSTLAAPAFLYWGSEDGLVPLSHLERWRGALPHVAAVRLYEGEGHDVQYRHWDQILADVAHLGERVVVSQAGRTLLVDPARAEELLAAGATLGLAAWADEDEPEPRSRGARSP
ncbi:MAG TPA: alpha/beta fold hydrolase [Gaiellaceae bacterium]|nr:alpha/beta fold hydrolase [Gaiellaceae bacterium]